MRRRQDNNGNVVWIGGGVLNDLIVAINTSIPQTPAPPQMWSDKNGCGHDFVCLTREFSSQLGKRNGEACSNPTDINQPNFSSWQRMFIQGYGDPSWLEELWFNLNMPRNHYEQ
jgi:hypothetical protein